MATIAWNVLLEVLHLRGLPIHGGLPGGADQYSFQGTVLGLGGGKD